MTVARTREVALHALASAGRGSGDAGARSRRRRPARRSGTAAARPRSGSRPCTAPISISPVGSAGLTVPSGRVRTAPVTRTTYSLRRSWAPSTTHCTMPVRSRTSMKARCSPCSRRRATQPHTATVAADVVGPQLAAVVGAHRATPAAGRARSPSVGVTSSVREEGRARSAGHLGPTVDRALRHWPVARCCAPSPDRAPARRSPTMSTSGAPERSAVFICDFIDRAGRSKARSTAEPGAAQLARSDRAPPRRRRRRPRTRRATESARGTRLRRRRSPAPARCPMPKPMPGRRRAAERLDQTVVAAAAADRVLGRRRAPPPGTRRWCACSSRARGRGAARCGSRCRPRSARPAPGRSGPPPRADSWSSSRGASATTSWLAARFESSTRMGCVSTFSRSSGSSSSRRSARNDAQPVDVAGPVGRRADRVESQVDLAQAERRGRSRRAG